MPSSRIPVPLFIRPNQLHLILALLLVCCIGISQLQAAPLQTELQKANFKTLPGFEAQLVYSVPKAQGSWVSLAKEKDGCLVASDQYGKLYRINVTKNPVSITPLKAPIGRAQGLLYAFDSLYVMAHPGGGKPGGIYRLSQLDDSGQYQKTEFLRKLEGGGEHGPHAIVMSPGGKSLTICAGNHTNLPKVQKSRVPRNWREDQVLPRMWDAGGHAVGKVAPGGWIAKMSPDGKELECLSIGFRNQYDIAYSPEGELFTYDADMEWDIGTPWYRPTRVNHVVSGSEFGWRSGTGKWPDFYPDSLGSVVDIGPGSPTGIVFGTDSNYAGDYKRALFIADWSYGVIYAVHLSKNGATFQGKAERFCSAPALQVADMEFLPSDGCLYFVVGGRRTKSAMYRIKMTDRAKVQSPETFKGDQNSVELFGLRKKLEQMHIPGSKNWREAVAYLGHEDRNIRYAARIALEHSGKDELMSVLNDLPNARAKVQAALAVCRSLPASDQRKMATLKMLFSVEWKGLSKSDKLDWLRAVGLVKSRWGSFSDQQKSQLSSILKNQFPTTDSTLNQELSRLLVAFQFPWATEVCVDLLKNANSQQEQIHFAYCLCYAENGWTMPLRESYFDWFLKAAALQGGNSFGGFIRKIRTQAIKTMKVDSLPADDKKKIETLLARRPNVADPAALLAKRKFVRKWTTDDVLKLKAPSGWKPNFKNGEKMFRVGLCFNCHRKDGQGGMVGPDLTAVGRRMKQHDLVQSIVDPSEVISDQYEATMFLLEDGKVVIGRVANLSGNRYSVQTDMLKPSRFTNIKADQIDEMQASETSMMPSGLIDTMTEQDVLDLLAYLRKQKEQKN